MKYGVCAVPEDASALAEAGFDYVEVHVQRLLRPEEDETSFSPELRRIQASSLPCSVANCFVPGHLKITGPEVDLDALTRYVTVACRRAQRAGIQTIVFGSGGARRIPNGFDRRKAWQQLLNFGEMLGPIAQQHDVTIVVEPLNTRETNVLNSIGESADYVRQVDHPSVRLLVDAYHWALEEDSVEDLITAAPLIRHAHIATYRSRLAPGLERCDFSGFFRALKDGGYDGRLSIEGKWDDLSSQAADALAELGRFAQEVGL